MLWVDSNHLPSEMLASALTTHPLNSLWISVHKYIQCTVITSKGFAIKLFSIKFWYEMHCNILFVNAFWKAKLLYNYKCLSVFTSVRPNEKLVGFLVCRFQAKKRHDCINIQKVNILADISDKSLNIFCAASTLINENQLYGYLDRRSGYV